MRTAIGIILLLAGGGLIVYGLLGALQELRGLYEGATGNAMGMSPTAEKDASTAMIHAAIVGACGVPFFIAGTIMLKLTLAQRLMRTSRRSAPKNASRDRVR